MFVRGGTLASIKGDQPWHRSESPSEGILSYLWKSRCRLLMNRSYRPQSHRKKHRLLLSRSPSQCGSEGRTLMSPGENRIARHVKHDGFRVGEIIAYRAWRVINRGWLRSGDDRLHSVLMKDYVWHLNEPASGDVHMHGIYSFQNVIQSKEEYGYDSGVSGPLLFGRVKIWGEIVEHEAGYRSQFGKIVSLDSCDLSHRRFITLVG